MKLYYDAENDIPLSFLIRPVSLEQKRNGCFVFLPKKTPRGLKTGAARLRLDEVGRQPRAGTFSLVRM